VTTVINFAVRESNLKISKPNEEIKWKIKRKYKMFLIYLSQMCKTTHFRVKKRSKNFRVEETAVLVEEVEKRRALLFGPLKGPNLTQFHRDRGWQQVVDAVNAVAPTVRTAAELRSKFKDLKTRAKHRVNAVKREGRKTGGGQNEANTPLSAIDAKLSQFIGTDSIEGIAGGVDPFRRQGRVR
jgi:hypothetical protein